MRLARIVALACLAAVVRPAPARAWGLATHAWIATRAAELTTPGCPRLVAADRERLARLAVEPDTVLRARDGRREAVRHFLDLDAYGPPPFRDLPREHDAAVRRFGRAVVEERGVLPWHVERLAHRLRREIARGDWSGARRTAGHLAHYAADATMPLHATRNHDGQLTGQRGLHARVESRLVERRFSAYAARARDVPPRPSIRPDTAAAELFSTLERSSALSAPVLAADRTARRGTRVGSDLYFRRLDADLGSLLADRIGAAATLTAALWTGACQ